MEVLELLEVLVGKGQDPEKDIVLIPGLGRTWFPFSLSTQLFRDVQGPQDHLCPGHAGGTVTGARVGMTYGRRTGSVSRSKTRGPRVL